MVAAAAIAAGVGAVGAVAGASIASSGAKSAANTQAAAAQQAAQATQQTTQQSNALQYIQYLQSMQNQSPYMQGGQEALSALLGGYGLPNINATSPSLQNIGQGSPVQSLAGATSGGEGGYSSATGNYGVNNPQGPYNTGSGSGSLVSVDGSGTPQANAWLMANNPAYAQAWNNLEAQSQAKYGSGFTNASPVANINSSLQQALQSQGVDLSTLNYGPQTASAQVPGVGTIGAANYGASQGALNQAYGTLAPGSLSQGFTNADLNAQLAPSYQFMLNQGLQSLQASDIANGTLMSGQGAKDVTNYAENYASTGYQQAFNNYLANQQNQFNQLSTIAGLGTGPTNVASEIGSQTGQSIANTNMTGQGGVNALNLGAATASASGSVSSANALSKGLGQLGQYAGQAISGYNNNGSNNAGFLSQAGLAEPNSDATGSSTPADLTSGYSG